MNGATDSKNLERSAPARFDPPALRAAAVFAACIAAAGAFVAWGRVTHGPAWQAVASRAWLAALLGLLVVAVALVALDITRRKNVSWRHLRARFGQPFEPAPDPKNHGAGQGRLGPHTYWGVRSMGSKGGLIVARMVGPLYGPLHIPWSAVSAVEAYPNVLTGRRGFETDMGAKLTLRGAQSVTLEVPWLAEFRQFMPNSVRFRLVKLPAQG